MSRSFKHTPIGGICGCKSEKEDKKILHGRTRTIIRNKMKKVYQEESSEEYIDPLPEEVMSVWSMGKDGKSGYWIPRPFNPMNTAYSSPEELLENYKRSLRK